jgi:Na+-translocating ferredoxin:NAD+ oxidoreductase subunit C
VTVKTFNRGVFLPHFKKFSEEKAITTISLPKEVVIPLHQHTGAPCHAVVKVGDKVKTGQKIGESDAFVSAYIHASVDGTVTAVEPRPYFTGSDVESVVIAVDEEQTEPKWKKRDTAKLSADEIKAAVKEAGIVGMGGAAFPTHVKLSPPRSIDAVIINACECEPFLTCDHRMMVEDVDSLVEGTKLIARAVGAPKIIFGVETNKPDGIEALNLKIAGDSAMEVVALDVKYPQGAEKQLIKAAMDREVPPGKLPFDVGLVVQNVATAIAVYEACLYGKPLYERVLTVTGDGAANPGNVKVRIGTPIGHIIEECGGFKGASIEEGELDTSEVRYPVFAPAHLVGKIILGGPMTGWSQSRLDVPVVKGSSGILIFTPEMVVKSDYMACVRCAKCVEHCPMFLYPNYIGVYSETGRHELAADWGAMDCFECGICVYVCPSNRPIVQFVRDTKKQVLAARAAKK